MKYILILGIIYQYYKKPAVITVKANNRYIDQFSLDKDAPKSTLKKLRTHIKHEHLKKLDHWMNNRIPSIFVEKFLNDEDGVFYHWPNMIKTFEIDEEYLTGDLKIEVENANSNYTNGFMTKSSLVKFAYVGLIPKDFFKNNSEKLITVLDRFATQFDKYDKKQKTSSVWQLPRPDKHVYDLTKLTKHLNYNVDFNPQPMVPIDDFIDRTRSFLDDIDSTDHIAEEKNILEIWLNDAIDAKTKEDGITHITFPHKKLTECQWPMARYANIQRIDKKTNQIVTTVEHLAHNWLGGSFSVQITVKKKHNLKYLFTDLSEYDTDIGFWDICPIRSHIPLIKQINTYDEDQRSNNT